MARWQDQAVRTATVSQFYKLGLDQSALDFVDVDVVADTALFLDPRATRMLDSAWASDCVAELQSFFRAVLAAVKKNDEEEGLSLLRGLNEPNDTRLGLSRQIARGRGLGAKLGEEVWEALCDSEAAASGLLQDLEDTALLIEGIGTDRISDITTNVIRGPLIAYTQEMCAEYGIEVVDDIDTGQVWDGDNENWITDATSDLPAPFGRRLLLVPKSIVRIKLDFDPSEYYQHYILTFLRDRELSERSELVRLLKNGQARVTKKDVAAKYRRKYGTRKQQIIEVTKEHPKVLDYYRGDKERPPYRRPPLSLNELAERSRSELPDWDKLLNAVTKIPKGASGWVAYQKAIKPLFDALFWPQLLMGKAEVKIHGGRKRLDIRYVNSAGGTSLFSWVAANYGPAPYVTVECKNYTGDPENTELDQLIARFSDINGKLGVLALRQLDNKPLFIERCKDAAIRGQGFIIPLEDDDLATLVKAKKAKDDARFDEFFHERFSEITD